MTELSIVRCLMQLSWPLRAIEVGSGIAIMLARRICQNTMSQAEYVHEEA